MTREELQKMKEECSDYFVRQYMDLDNGKNMELKEQVLKALKSGKKPPQIPGYDDVLDQEAKDLPGIEFVKF